MRSKAVLSKTLKSIHVLLAGGTIGGLAAILVLLGVKTSVDSAAWSALDRGVLAVFRSDCHTEIDESILLKQLY